MNDKNNIEKILVIDFGSQVTKLIARRIRELGVYSEVLTLKEFNNIKNYNFIKGIIFSGGPATVTKKNFPNVSYKVFHKKIPILGICYGLQLIAKNFGGKVDSINKKREFGRALLIKQKNSLLTKNFFKKKNITVWMSHQDSVQTLPKGFKKIASTKNSTNTIIENSKNKIYGIQFHPEVTHTEKGHILLKNFIYSICNAKKNWRIGNEKNKIISDIKKKVGSGKVICALSGGVDSSVVALLIHKAIKNNLKCIMVDTGLMRKNEFKYTYKVFKNKYKLNVKLVDASKIFYKKLNKVTDPEKKRKIIGSLFIKIFEKESKKFKNVKYLAQGTLYPVIIESFPGPGLAIRIIGKITKEKIKILQEADDIFIKELIKNNLYDKIWQAYAALLPFKTVGVMGDSRTFEYTCLIRAVTSEDGMTADYYNFSSLFLNKISNKIINGVRGINRVVYDITSKPPSTIELE